MAQVLFSKGLSPSDPVKSPVIIIGQHQHLARVAWEDIKAKLEPRVTQEMWSSGVSSLSPSPTDISLYMNLATVAALPAKVSRHNTQSRAHSITKIIKTLTSSSNESVVIVCRREDVYASGCAVARAYSSYSRKTTGDPPNVTSRGGKEAVVNVEFMIVDEDGEAESKAVPSQLSVEDIKALVTSCEAIKTSARIVDMPCNEMNTDAFVEEAKRIGAELGIVPTIIRGEELRERGFGGIYGVGKAAAHPPALVVLSHKPAKSSKAIAWVGKGIVYDTGGLSIKTKTGMPGMKRDCGGAAGILGAFYVAVKNGFQDTLHCVLCLAENAVGPLATRPDDIHTMYSGKTVEINNTDAEGRLVLSDGVAYASKDLGCDIVLDMATLTGAQGISTGKYHAMHLSNADNWETAVSEAGRVSGDLSFPGVYCPELQYPEFSSSVADMKNSVADRGNAQSSCAGLFINSHLGFEWPGVWMHVDMAAPAYTGERATGYGVALLNVLFGDSSGAALLRSAAPKCHHDNGESDHEGNQGGKMKKMKLK